MAQSIRTPKQPKPALQSPIAKEIEAGHAGRVWGGRPITSGVERYMLPHNHPKYRPMKGSRKWGNGMKEYKPDQQWKYYDVALGKYIYALSRPKGKAGKGWVKA